MRRPSAEQHRLSAELLVARDLSYPPKASRALDPSTHLEAEGLGVTNPGAAHRFAVPGWKPTHTPSLLN